MAGGVAVHGGRGESEGVHPHGAHPAHPSHGRGDSGLQNKGLVQGAAQGHSCRCGAAVRLHFSSNMQLESMDPGHFSFFFFFFFFSEGLWRRRAFFLRDLEQFFKLHLISTLNISTASTTASTVPRYINRKMLLVSFSSGSYWL